MQETALQYARQFSADPAIIERILAAVNHGISISHLQRKAIGCPVEHAAYMYAISWPLNTEDQFRLRQAVLFGYSLGNTPITQTDPLCLSDGSRANDLPRYHLSTSSGCT